MAKYLQKFNSLEAYNEAEHDYPNVSLIDGEGLVYKAEDACLLTETEAQMLENQAVIEDVVAAFNNRDTFDANFYFLKSDVVTMLEGVDTETLKSMFNMLYAYTDSFMVNCESATIGLRQEGESSNLIYKIGVEPESGAKAPAPLEDYVSIEIQMDDQTGDDIVIISAENMLSDRYDFHVVNEGL